MTLDDLRVAITATPFRPFLIFVADGRYIPVLGRDFALISPRGLTVAVYQPDDRHDLLDARHITGIQFLGPNEPTPTAGTNRAS